VDFILVSFPKPKSARDMSLLIVLPYLLEVLILDYIIPG